MKQVTASGQVVAASDITKQNPDAARLTELSNAADCGAAFSDIRVG
jgi:hypothetical protein